MAKLGFLGVEGIKQSSLMLLGGTKFIFIFLNFLFCVGVWPVNNVVIVSGEQ